MYKDFNVIMAVVAIIFTTCLFVYCGDITSYEPILYVQAIGFFMIWLDGKIDYLIDEIKKEMREKK